MFYSKPMQARAYLQPNKYALGPTAEYLRKSRLHRL